MRWKNFDLQFWSGSATNAKVLDIRPKTVGQNKNVSSAVRIILTKNARIKKRKPKCAKCKGSHVASYKGCPEYKKKQAFRQHLVNKQKTYAPTVSQNTLPQPKTSNETFSFTADTLDLKSRMCRKVSNAAETILNIDTIGKDLFQSVLSAPVFPLNPSHS